MTVIYSVAASLDGFIASVDGSFDWLVPYPPDTDFDSFVSSVGAVLMGRESLDATLSLSGAVYPELPVAVMSNRKIPGGIDNVRRFAGDIRQAVDWLASRSSLTWLFGGGSIAGQALAAGLIDEIHLAVVPVALGDGRPLFGNVRIDPLRWDCRGAVRSVSGYTMMKYDRVAKSN